MTAMVLAVVADAGGIRRNHRTSHNGERDQSKQDVTKHLHDVRPQENQSGRSLFRAVRYNAA
jgi:hypothetical protein